jgi:hypothetical protein
VPDADSIPGDKHIEQQRTDNPTVTDPLARPLRPGDPTNRPEPTDGSGKEPDRD